MSFLHVSLVLFFIGFLGLFISRSNLIIILICLEILLLSCTLNFVLYSSFLDDLLGQLYGLFILCLAASESALGLALLIVYYRLRGGISTDLITLLKG